MILRRMWSQSGQRIVVDLSLLVFAAARDDAVMPTFSAKDLRALADSCATLPKGD